MNVVAYNIIRKMVQEPESVEWKIDRNTCYAHYVIHFKNNHLVTITYDIKEKHSVHSGHLNVHTYVTRIV